MIEPPSRRAPRQYLVRRLRFRIRVLAGVSKRDPVHTAPIVRAILLSEKIGSFLGKNHWG